MNLTQSTTARISVDASIDHALEVAVLAGVRTYWGRDRLLFLDAIGSTHSNEAEFWALLEAMRIADQAGWKHVRFTTDSSAVKRRLDGHRLLGPADQLDAETAHALGLLDRRKEWSVGLIDRKHNARAHTACAQGLKMYRAGVDRTPTLPGLVVA